MYTFSNFCLSNSSDRNYSGYIDIFLFVLRSKKINPGSKGLLYVFRPDRYVPIFGGFSYDSTKWRPSVPFEDQLKAFQELIDEGKVLFPFS
jgi:hypothetical protein